MLLTFCWCLEVLFNCRRRVEKEYVLFSKSHRKRSQTQIAQGLAANINEDSQGGGVGVHWEAQLWREGTAIQLQTLQPCGARFSSFSREAGRTDFMGNVLILL